MYMCDIIYYITYMQNRKILNKDKGQYLIWYCPYLFYRKDINLKNTEREVSKTWEFLNLMAKIFI